MGHLNDQKKPLILTLVLLGGGLASMTVLPSPYTGIASWLVAMGFVIVATNITAAYYQWVRAGGANPKPNANVRAVYSK